MAYQGNHPLTTSTLGDRDIRRLLHKHAAIERQIGSLMNSVQVDWDGVKLLKMEKLKLMREMDRLRAMKRLH